MINIKTLDKFVGQEITMTTYYNYVYTGSKLEKLADNKFRVANVDFEPSDVIKSRAASTLEIEINF
tara:strand:+ start:11636 stop:11833 length:198 start_codon:yes stop_codon:yes gene_type:complete